MGAAVAVTAPGAPLFYILCFQIRLFSLFTYGVSCPKGLKTSAGKHLAEMRKHWHFRNLAQKRSSPRKQAGVTEKRWRVQALGMAWNDPTNC